MPAESFPMLGVGAPVAVALAAVAAAWLWAELVRRVLRPYAVERAFARQGVRGPPYRLVGGGNETKAMLAATSGDTLDRSSHDFIPRVMPHYRAWTSLYGKVCLTWGGTTPMLCVGSYDMVKRVLSDRSGLYRKPDPGPAILALLGMGLVFTDGEDWKRHRRVVHPAFAMDKLKTMASTMAACAAEVIGRWESRAAAAAGQVTVEVGEQFGELTADVIAHTAFGSSYRQGKEVFLAQRELQGLAFAFFSSRRFPGSNWAPTESNLRRWRLERKVRDTLLGIIHERLAAAAAGGGGGYGGDLLGLMLEANAAGGDGKAAVMSMDEIVDECKTFFFAGHDTTSHLLTWAMFLLGTHPDWQRRLREEVLRECGGGAITGDALSKLKLTTMVLYETLRLYGAVTLMARRAAADVELCGVRVPRGTMLMIPVAMLHRDEDAWGADAGEFNPLRFKDGVGRAAAHPMALLAFSAGPRSCIGQDFAMMEAKAALALILRRFEFEVAPEYVHAPADFLTLQPMHGLPIVLKLLDP
ncbi:unnamed protein product [Urochloa decumbens]|uniref:Cytochrome P450 n=1 Tax=Urochloa decumbens TaxID=240449 RepID=A0ABC9DVD6_9POAL